MNNFLIIATGNTSELGKPVTRNCDRFRGERTQQRGEKQAIFSTCAERSNNVSREDCDFQL